MSNIKLVSLHIPKTAGTSFYKTIQDAYGITSVARLDIKPNINKILLNTIEYNDTFLPDEIEVIHGHFNVLDLYEKYPETKDLPMITWLRDPVTRVISNYFYLQERLTTFLSSHENNRAILDKMMKSIEEFIATDINRNKMSRFLIGKNLSDFKFVGLIEYYEEDLQSLSNLLNIQFNQNQVNVTANDNKYDVSSDIIELIKQYNQEDIALYEEAISIRNKRLS